VFAQERPDFAGPLLEAPLAIQIFCRARRPFLLALLQLAQGEGTIHPAARA